ncbi:MAG: hypothetical protein ACRCZ9_09565 [Fusobacteriaceae bacterium]
MLGTSLQGQPGQFLTTNGSSAYFADPISCQSLGTKIKTCFDTFSSTASTYLGVSNGVVGYYKQAAITCADVSSKLLDLNCVTLSTAVPQNYLGQVNGALAWVAKPKQDCIEFLDNLKCVPASLSVPTEVIGTVNGSFALMPYPKPLIDCTDLKNKLVTCIPAGSSPATSALTLQNGSPVFAPIDTAIKCPDLLAKIKSCVGSSAIPADNTLTYQNGILVTAPIDTTIKCNDLISKLENCAKPGAANPSTVLSIQGGQLITSPLNLALSPSAVSTALVTAANANPSTTPATSVLTIVNGVVSTAPIDTTIKCTDLASKLVTCIQTSSTLTNTAITIQNGVPVLATIDTSIKCADLVTKLVLCGGNNTTTTPATTFLSIQNGQLVTAPLPASASGIVCTDLLAKLASCATPTTQTFNTALVLSGGNLYNAVIDTAIKCPDLISKLQSCSVSSSTPVTSVLSFTNGQLVYAPLPASASGIVCSDLLAKLSSCSSTTSTPATSFLQLTNGQLVTAPVNANALIQSANAALLAAAVASGIASSGTPATTVLTLVGGQIVSAPAPVVGISANTSSIAGVSCTDFISKLSNCSTPGSTPSSTALALVNGQLVSAPIATTSLASLACSDLVAKISSCTTTGTTPAATYLTIANGGLVLAPLPAAGTSANTNSISNVPAAEVCRKLIQCIGVGTTYATEAVTIENGVLVLSKINTVAIDTTSIASVSCSDFTSKLAGCAVSSTTTSATYLTLQNGQLVTAPLPAGGTASNTTSISNVPASEVCAKLVSCATNSSISATSVLTVQSGVVVLAPLPTGGTAANTSSISAVPASEVCAKLIACAATSVTPASSVLTVQGGAVVLAPLPTGGTSANTNSISLVPAAEVCAKLVSCAATSTIPATSVLTVQSGAVVLAPKPVMTCSELTTLISGCLPVEKLVCNKVDYLLGATVATGTLAKIITTSYEYYLAKSEYTAVGTAKPVGWVTLNIPAYAGGTEETLPGCTGINSISNTSGVFTVTRDMFVLVTASYGQQLNSVTGGGSAFTLALWVDTPGNPVDIYMFGSATAPPIDGSVNGSVSGAWSGFVPNGTTITLRELVDYAGTGGSVKDNPFGKNVFTITELPRKGFDHY